MQSGLCVCTCAPESGTTPVLQSAICNLHSNAHEPSAGADDAYRQAYAAAQPDPGRRVIPVVLEAREVDWEFVPGTRTRAWGYNGQIPGPMLEGQVGEVLEIRFTNRLPQPTNIHWHGLRVPAAMDGTEMVQRSVAPGALLHSAICNRRGGHEGPR
jgi:FtsP/CotA-like multicopper oxidase with cupredoxin domain